MKKTLGIIMDGNCRFAKKLNLSEEDAYTKEEFKQAVAFAEEQKQNKGA